MASQLTPLQLIAGKGLSDNTGVQVNSELVIAANDYDSTELISPLLEAFANSGNLLPSTVAELLSIGSNICPALGDSIPTAQQSQLEASTSGFVDSIIQQGSNYFGSGDNSIFVQVFTGAEGYISSVNDFILTANNSSTYLGSSFTSMNSLITANLSDVNLALGAFGQDLANLGSAINLNNLDNFGSPLALLQQLSTVAGLTPAIIRNLELLGYDNTNIINEPPENLTELVTLERLAYGIMLKIKGNDLAQVLALLKVKTAGMTTMADLLNPVKLFPQSFPSLTVKLYNKIEKLYVDAHGTINSNLIQVLPSYIKTQVEYLSRIIPSDQALATQSMRAGLQQIKNISNIQLPDLAGAFLYSETTRDLDLINNLTEAVPADVVNYYKSVYGTGTGVEGTLVISDIIGSAAGIGYTDPIRNVVSVLNSLYDSGQLTYLIEIYVQMAATANGDYTDTLTGITTIPSGPGAGTYSTIDEAFTIGLIPLANAEIVSIVATNPAAAETLNDNYLPMAERLAAEISYLDDATIVVADLIPNQQSAILSFVQTLPSYGVDIQAGGAAQYLELVADFTTRGGQAIVGCLRQGRNSVLLGAGGVEQDIEIPNVPNQEPEKAVLIPSTYTAAEAASIIGN